MLNENKLTSLKNDWFGKVFYSVDLRSNPIMCNCNIYKTYKILHLQSKVIQFFRNCSSPRSFENISIQKHFQENLSNCTACSVNKCQNNANCTVFDAQSFTYNCTCPRQFFGKYCETENFCFDAPCMNNGTCLNNLKNFTGQCEYIGGTDYLLSLIHI